MLVQNIEHRQLILEYVERLPNVEYKRRLGGENSLFYFSNPHLVLLLCEKYGAGTVNSVTGPINSEHEDVHSGSENIITRKGLYYNKFRYCVRFKSTERFVTDPNGMSRIQDVLGSISTEAWRTHSFESVQNYWSRQKPFANRWISAPAAPSVYLTSPHDYVYLKLVGGEYVEANHEIVLFDELT